MKLGILKKNEVCRIKVAPLDKMYLAAIRETLIWDIYLDIKETLLMRRNETW